MNSLRSLRVQSKLVYRSRPTTKGIKLPFMLNEQAIIHRLDPFLHPSLARHWSSHFNSTHPHDVIGHAFCQSQPPFLIGWSQLTNAKNPCSQVWHVTRAKPVNRTYGQK